jgi:hypothetical protein
MPPSCCLLFEVEELRFLSVHEIGTRLDCHCPLVSDLLPALGDDAAHTAKSTWR